MTRLSKSLLWAVVFSVTKGITMHRTTGDFESAFGGNRWGAIAVVVLALSALLGCGSSSRNAYAIKATVSGLAGRGLEIWMNGHDPVSVEKDGEVTLAYMVIGYYYSVSVKTQPTSPAQTCTVENATGVMGSADVTNVTVTCATTYAISGTITGLQGLGLVLNNNSGDDTVGEDLSITSTGSIPFAFPTRVAANTKYTVIVKTQPTGPVQTCSVGKATGTVGSTDVTDVTVVCSNNAFQVGGTVTGLASGTKVVLKNNGTNDLEVTGSGSSPVSFAFSQRVADGAIYEVKVTAQPTNPWQTCMVTNGTGTIASEAISNVSVNCNIDSYSIGGAVSGLGGHELVLTTNGEDLTVDTGSVAFLFKNRLPSLTSYDVKVKTQPTNPKQICIVTNGAGTVEGNDVLDVVVTCPAPLVAVGDSVAATSLDGTTWTARAIPAGKYFSVAWNGSVFVAVGDDVAATSPDGSTWTSRTIPTGYYTSIASNGSTFVAVGSYNAVISTDGITWTALESLFGDWVDITWSGSTFVAIGRAQSVATSPDGVTWTPRSCDWGLPRFIAANESLFVVMADIAKVYTSPNGVTWTSVEVNASCFGAAWNGSIFAAIESNRVFTSPNGSTWTSRTIPTGANRAIASSGSTFVVVGDNVAATSPDGTTWVSRPIPVGTYLGIASSIPR